MLKSIAKVKSDDRIVDQLQNNIIPVVRNLVNNPIVLGIIIQRIALVSGDNVIQHKLGRLLQGWYFVRQRAAVSVYDKQDTNPVPGQTLILNSTGSATVDIYVF